MNKPVAIVFGVGAELGLGRRRLPPLRTRRSSRARRRTNHDARSNRSSAPYKASGGSAEALATDVTREADVIAAFDRAMAPGTGFEPADAVVYNAGNNQLIDFRTLSAEQFEDFWRIGCFAGFLVGREAARRLVPLGRGTVLFTGASGSLRGKPGYAHFAAAKAGLRMLAQSMAREFGPQGIHVAHVVIDGGIDGDRLRRRRPEMVAERGADGLLGIDAIAETYWQLHRQHRSAWAQEIDLRPYKEAF